MTERPGTLPPRNCLGTPPLRNWATCLLAALGLHLALLACALAPWRGPTPAPVAVAPPASLLVDLMPASAASLAQNHLPPGPPMVEAVAQPRPQPRPEPEPRREPKPEPPTPRKPRTIEAKPPPVVPRKDAVKLASAPKETDAAPPQQAQTGAVATTAAPSLPAPMAEQTRAAERGASSQLAQDAAHSWESQLLARLERFKRYPGYAQRMKQEDIVYLKFAIDRNGRLLSYDIERSRGFNLLDQEARALIRRAAPFPAPPEEVAGERIEMVVPIEFFLRRA